MATNNAINQYGVLPAFLAVNNADQSSVTGNGTDYLVTFVNEIYDATNDFDGTSTFTAPRTGTYFFEVGLYASGITNAVTDSIFKLVTTGATYYFDEQSFTPSQFTAGGFFAFTGSMICQMTATDTAKVYLYMTGIGSDDVNIVGATAAGFRTPYFGAHQIYGL